MARKPASAAKAAGGTARGKGKAAAKSGTPHTQEDKAAYAELQTSDDIRSGYLTGPGVDHLPVQFSVIDGRAIFDSCIDLGPVDEVLAEAEAYREAQAEALASPLRADEPAAAQDPDLVLSGVGLPTTSNLLWPNCVVPFTIDSSLQSPNRVNQAIAHLNERSPVRLIPHTNQTNFVRFIGAAGSSSRVGMGGGRQDIRLSATAPVGTVVHEILHAIGIYHEQSRSDRDAFIDIRWQNIEQDARHNFQTVPGSVDYFDYDYGSIMHYPRGAFSSNGQDTIIPRQAGVTIGQRTGLSWQDRQTIAKLYERFFTKGYSGVWRAGSGRYGMWINATWDSFRAKWQEWSGQGLRLVDIHTRRVGNETRYSGVFLPGTGGHGLWANVSWDSFRTKHQEWTQQGLRCVSLHAHAQGNQLRWSGAFLPGSGAWGLWVNANWDSFRSKWQEWSGQGLRLIDLHVHKVNGTTRYSGVFAAGTGGHGLWANVTWDSFVAKWREWSNQGLRLVDLAIHRDGSQNRYSGVFRQGSGAYYLWANMTWEGFRAKWEELAERGLRLVDYDFPAAEAGGVQGDPDSLFEAEDPLLDLGLEVDGFGGIFGDSDGASRSAEKEGLGGLVMGEGMGPDLPVPDGEGEASLPTGTIVDEEGSAGQIGGGG
jgi:hypothetical protein